MYRSDPEKVHALPKINIKGSKLCKCMNRGKFSLFILIMGKVSCCVPSFSLGMPPHAYRDPCWNCFYISAWNENLTGWVGNTSRWTWTPGKHQVRINRFRCICALGPSAVSAITFFRAAMAASAGFEDDMMYKMCFWCPLMNFTCCQHASQHKCCNAPVKMNITNKFCTALVASQNWFLWKLNLIIFLKW